MEKDKKSKLEDEELKYDSLEFKKSLHIDESNHAINKFLKRIQGVEEKRDINSSITRERAMKQISKLVEYSKFIYRGQLGNGDNNTTANYYLNGTTAILTNDERIITIYDVEYDFPQDISEVVVKGLAQEIETLKESYKEKKEENEVVAEDIRALMREHDEEIEALKEQISSRESLKEGLKGTLSMLTQEERALQREITKNATLLFSRNQLKVIK